MIAMICLSWLLMFYMSLRTVYVYNVGSVEDSVHCNIAYKSLSFRPGEVHRRFIRVPYGATWAGQLSVDVTINT